MSYVYNDAILTAAAYNERSIAFHELEQVENEAVVTPFRVLFRNLRGGTEENHKIPQSE
jgi:hypothetical protein